MPRSRPSSQNLYSQLNWETCVLLPTTRNPNPPRRNADRTPTRFQFAPVPSCILIGQMNSPDRRRSFPSNRTPRRVSSRKTSRLSRSNSFIPGVGFSPPRARCSDLLQTLVPKHALDENATPRVISGFRLRTAACSATRSLPNVTGAHQPLITSIKNRQLLC